MDHRLKSYLRTFRRRFGFTQMELAFLIGTKSRTAISRIEGAKRRPGLNALYACAFIFDTPPPELFPDLISELHEAMLDRAYELHEKLQGNPSKTTRIKLDFLEQLMSRLGTERPDPFAW
jgi:transcriptional regulator with XRE-family HTH domain